MTVLSCYLETVQLFCFMIKNSYIRAPRNLTIKGGTSESAGSDSMQAAFGADTHGLL